MPNNKSANRKLSVRTLARTVAFQVLYQEDMNTGSASEYGIDYINEQLNTADESMRILCQSLVIGTRSHVAEIDKLISEMSTNWSIERMAVTDRNILRLAVYEILHEQTPRPVVINEAIELAKRFGATTSASFVNGVLDKIEKTSAESTDANE
ncbi:MAG: transcription antitermination factor NusB [Planctomycetaceae bacterium]|jgi:N utilization substance protein B|nr:transcription antitermination factor NusB [Planctomycetaceae bacterium]